MATVGNERYLRHIWLLGDGGLLILRGIVSREASTCGQPFETFLAGKRSQFNYLFDVQRLKLFPDHSTVNSDTKTWDMSLLIIVVKRLFRASLSPAEQISINTLKTYRNEMKAHPHCMSMEASDYSSSTNFLKTALCQLASGLSADTNTQLQDIIKCAESETIDIKSALQHLTELNEFKETFLQKLEKSLLQVTSEIQKVHSSVNNLKADVDTIGKDQLAHHRELSSKIQEVTVVTKKSQKDLSEIKEHVNVITKLIFGQMNKKEVVVGAKRTAVKEFEIILQMSCDDNDNDKKEKATDILYDMIRLIQNGHNFSEEKVREMIYQKIRENGKVTLQLIEDVLAWFKDIDGISDSSLGFAYKGSIRIPIQCFSEDAFLSQMHYMSRSSKCFSRLSRISSTLSKLLGFSCFITCSGGPDLLTDVLKEHSTTSEAKTIVLPFYCKPDHGLTDIRLFGNKNKHTEKISKTLSDIIDAKITLEICIDIDPNQLQKKHKSRKLLPSFESKRMKESPISLFDPGVMQLPSYKRLKMMELAQLNTEEFSASNLDDIQDSLHPQRSLQRESRPSATSATFQMRQPEGQQENSLQLELMETYPIKDNTDVSTPHVYGLEMLPEEGFILIDKSNKKLKKLDKALKTVSFYYLSDSPWDVCYIDEGKVAVSLGWNGILFADVSGIIKMEKVVHLNIFCGGLAFFGNILYTGDTRSSIYSYTSGDTQPRFLYQNAQGIHSTIWRLAVSQSGEKIYMVCYPGITTINANGRQLACLKYEESGNASDICVINDGTILVSDLHSNNVIQINSEGTEVLRTFTLQNIRPFTICYDRQESRLIVGGLDTNVHVYKLPAL